MLFAKFWRGQCRVFSRDILKRGNIGVGLAGGKGVLGVYHLLENIIHYYYCQSEGGEDSPPSPPSPPLENTLALLLRSLVTTPFQEFLLGNLVKTPILYV